MRAVSVPLAEHQKEALVDLLVLGMYADRRLAAAEDEYLQNLLNTFSFDSDYDRQAFADASFTRVRRHSGSARAIRGYLSELAERFPSVESRQIAFEMLSEILTADGLQTREESEMLAAVRAAFNTEGRLGSTN